jgi:hypothetical protein
MAGPSLAHGDNFLSRKSKTSSTGLAIRLTPLRGLSAVSVVRVGNLGNSRRWGRCNMLRAVPNFLVACSNLSILDNEQVRTDLFQLPVLRGGI